MTTNKLVIDVSHWNNVGDWGAVYGAGVRGVIHKYSEGGTYVDPAYAGRRAAAKAAGLLWGRYHFATNSDVSGQVKHFLTGWQADELMALDWEDSATKMTLQQAEMFVSLVEQLTGQLPALYSGNTLKEALEGVPSKILSRCRLWLAQYSSKPVCPPGWDRPWLWQWTDKGVCPGVSGPVDLDTYAGTASALAEQWCPGTRPPQPVPAPEPTQDVYTIRVTVPAGTVVDVQVDRG